MEEHPNRQPRRAVTMQRRNDDDRQADQDFESDWADKCALRKVTNPA